MRINKTLLIIAPIIFCALNATAQEVVHSFSEEFTFGATDPQGHFYLVNGDQLVKTDKLGNYLYTFSDPGQGNITWIDPSDPLRLLVYFQSFNQLLFLDRTLSPLGDPLSLDELGLYSPAAICRSSQGGFWVVDELNRSIIKLDSKLEKSVNRMVSGIRFNRDMKWLPMMEWKERLYLCIPDSTIIQYDLFGTRIKNIPARAESFGFSGLSLVFSGQHGSFYYSGTGVLKGPEKPLDITLDKLIISGDTGLVKDKSGWHLLGLKKTY